MLKTRPGDLEHEDVSIPIYARLQSHEGDRSPGRLEAIVDALDPEGNPRYRPRDTSGDGRTDTHCDALVADFCTSMGVYCPFDFRRRELSANGTIDWLRDVGPGYGWWECDEREAREQACAGRPVVAAWTNPAGSGHVAVVLPTPEAGELLIAQAGRVCLRRAPLSRGFGAARPIRFYTHP